MSNRKSWSLRRRILTFAAIFFVSPLVIGADTPPPKTDTTPPKADTPPPKVDYNNLKVVHVWGINDKNGAPADESNGLYNTIVVKIDKLADWAQQDSANDPSKLNLFLDGDQINVNTIKIDKVRESELSYVLFPRNATEEGWKDLLGRPRTLKRAVSVTVGLTGKLPIASDFKIKLTIINAVWFYIYIALMIVLIIFLVWLARASDLLRDAGPKPAAGRKPYSLGRTQMAFWFFLVVASFCFIFLVTSAYEVLTASVLALIGISAGTALSSAIIDTSKRTTAQNDLDTVMVEKAALDAEQKTLIAAGSDLDASKKTRLDQLNAKVNELKLTLAPKTSDRFDKDILSDASGISFHRFQMAIWTLVLGVVFIVRVYNALSMPDFPGELLALMGISGGTYLGFKFPEKQS
jgi:hypothetical protein